MVLRFMAVDRAKTLSAVLGLPFSTTEDDLVLPTGVRFDGVLIPDSCNRSYLRLEIADGLAGVLGWAVTGLAGSVPKNPLIDELDRGGGVGLELDAVGDGRSLPTRLLLRGNGMYHDERLLEEL